jgi:glucose/arabinose dehydrogenase
VTPSAATPSERHAFRIETVASGLHPLPFSIAPLPDGRFLVTEKVRGLRIVSANGEASSLIEGTPPAHDDGFELASLVYGRGWMLDVALHPDHATNGWVYLHFGDRCRDCDTSMNKLIRGRIVDGRWVDEETIWSAAPETYTDNSDMGAGGRIAFDGDGHVFLSVGIKGPSDHEGIQDLHLPYGKIHRVHDDGRVPADNPFVGVDGALPASPARSRRSGPTGIAARRASSSIPRPDGSGPPRWARVAATSSTCCAPAATMAGRSPRRA